MNKMTRLILLFAVLCMAFVANAGAQGSQRHKVLLETSMGDIVFELLEETPLHRDNFVKLVREGYYDGVLFHRVISDFMIQTGDSASRHAQPGQQLGDTEEAYTVPAEIHYPQIFHKRGMVAAAREGDDVNPERKSSMAQFYIVWGHRFNEVMLDKVQQKLDDRTKGTVKLTPEVRAEYRRVGGTPHLDGQYTVFGEVTGGLDVVEKIQGVSTDSNSRPLEDVRIFKATLLR